jgi:ubiquinone/menaquinone biosynthesis C-methylase UbiE
LIGSVSAGITVGQAQRRAAEGQASIRFEEADAEQMPFAVASFDIAVSPHLLWTLPHPDQAMSEWIRVLRAGGRLIIMMRISSIIRPQPLGLVSHISTLCWREMDSNH